MKSTRFIITGLPRSRTSWLANLFNYGPCLCLHDGTATDKNVPMLLDQFANRNPDIKHIGNSDSGICLLEDLSWLDGYKVILVERDPSDVERSYYEYFKRLPYPQIGVMPRDKIHAMIEIVTEKLDAFVDNLGMEQMMPVAFDDLNDEKVVANLWRFIAPETPFHVERYRILDKLAVNPQSNKVKIAWL